MEEKKKIIIFGANGFLGTVLSRYLVGKGYEVFGVVRSVSQKEEGVTYLNWDAMTLGEWSSSLEGAFAIVNLAGRTVNCRYNEKNKAEILESRVETTALIGKAISLCESPPTVWLNSSTATIYQHSLAHPNTEAEGIIGDDFSMNVAKEWEKTFFDYSLSSQVRKVSTRTSIVFGAEQETVFNVLSKLVKLGLGGKMGSGQQMVSWIHEEDFCRAIEFLMNSPEIEGAVNVTSPNPLRNNEKMHALRALHKMSVGLPAQKWMLKIGAFIMGTETELILKSRFVLPRRLLESGFIFQWPDFQQAVEEIKKRS